MGFHCAVDILKVVYESVHDKHVFITFAFDIFGVSYTKCYAIS